MGYVVTFGGPEELPRLRDAIEYRFPFTVISDEFIGKPEQQARTSNHRIDVGASGTLAACWGIPRALMPKVLFEYGKRQVEQKLLDGALSPSEEFQLHTANAEVPCPFSPTLIPEPKGHRLVVATPARPLMEDSSFIGLAERIIDGRDNLNALFHDRHKEKLILLREERDLLQLLRAATSKQEFSYSICALANLASSMNLDKLRSITGEQDKAKQSISLLEIYLSTNSLPDRGCIKLFRNLNRLRQGYPVHGDRVDGVLKAYRELGLSYPVEDFAASWRILLEAYCGAVESLLAALKG